MLRRTGVLACGRLGQPCRSVASKAPAVSGKFDAHIRIGQLAQLGSNDLGSLKAVNAGEKHDAVQLTEAIWRLKTMQGLSEAPIRLHDTAGKYAHAVYSAAKKQGQVEKVATDLETVASVMAANGKFASYITNPSVDKPTKAAALGEVAKQHKFSDVTKRFLDLIIANGRANKINDVLNAVRRLVAAERNEVKVTVTTAGKISSAQMSEIEALLAYRVKKQYGSTAQMLLSTSEDAALLGGMVLEIGDYRMDLSLATKQQKLRAYLMDGI